MKPNSNSFLLVYEESTDVESSVLRMLEFDITIPEGDLVMTRNQLVTTLCDGNSQALPFYTIYRFELAFV